MIRELLGLAFMVLVIAAILGISYGIGDFRFYGGGQAGTSAGLRAFALALAVMGAPFFLIAAYAALRVRSRAAQALREARSLGYESQLRGLELTIRCPLPSADRARWELRFTPTAGEERPPFPRGWELVNPSSHQLPTTLVVTLLRTANTHEGGRITYENTGDAIIVRWDLGGWETRGGGDVRTRRVCEGLQAISEATNPAIERVDA
jgi:hypothetical protein